MRLFFSSWTPAAQGGDCFHSLGEITQLLGPVRSGEREEWVRGDGGRSAVRLFENGIFVTSTETKRNEEKRGKREESGPPSSQPSSSLYGE